MTSSSRRPSTPPDSASRSIAALGAHRTQITVDGVFFALSNKLGREALSVEHFRIVQGELGAERDAEGRETDLFAGLEL